jgi:methionyl-tRNA formyltransferase
MSQQGQARILLIGMGGTTPSALESLLAEFSVIGVVRDLSARTPSDEAVDKLARASRVTVFDDVAASAVDELVARLRPDCVVVSSYNRILKEQTLARCRFVNVHYSPLPRYRGRANVNWALINDEPAAGISIHVLAPNLDAGNILFQRLIPVHRWAPVRKAKRNSERTLGGHGGRVPRWIRGNGTGRGAGQLRLHASA